MMLDEKSAEFLATLYDCNEMTVAEANRLTGYDEGVSNPVTGMLQRYHYIEYVLGEYTMNADGQWADVDSSFRIAPEGRAYVESAKECKNDGKPNEGKIDDDENKPINAIGIMIGILSGLFTIAIGIWQFLIHYNIIK